MYIIIAGAGKVGWNLARELIEDDHEVVLVVPGDRDHDLGRTCDPGTLEHEHLGRVAQLDLVLELLLEPLVAIGALLDERYLVAAPEQGPRDVGADLPTPRDDREHQLRTRAARTRSVRVSYAVFVGQTTSTPRPA